MAKQTIVKAYRGPASGLPTLEAGQFGFTTDGNEVYIGDGVLNHLIRRAFISVHQVAHGFTVGNVIYCSGANTYTKAIASAAATADVVGVVSSSSGADDFVFCAAGKMTTGVPAVAAGTALFLSDGTAGLLTATEPTTVGHVSIPVAIVTENAVSMIVYSWRGAEVGAAITPRVGTTADSATPTPNADTDDMYTVTALAQSATFGAPTGTPLNGQKLIIRIKDNATAHVLAWNAIYRAVGVTLPLTTVLSKTHYVGCIYNTAATKWDVLAVGVEA
jgi:hypothetical protein